jgi:hypothetical protein
MLTPRIIRDIHNQQVREMERALPEGQSLAAIPRSTLRHRVGRGLIRVGYALAPESPRRLETPC